MLRRNVDLSIISGLALIAVVVALTGLTGTILGVPAGVLLFLVLPGYALYEALFAASAIGVPERVVLVLGMSLGVDVLGGLMLNVTPWGLRPFSWAVLLAGVTLVASAVAAIARTRGRPSHRIPDEDEIPSRPVNGRRRIAVRSAVLFGAALIVLAGALIVAYVGAVAQPQQPFTQLWMLPQSGAGQNALLLGVSNHEHTATTYTLELRLGNQVIRQWPKISLQTGAQWETTLTLSQDEIGAGQLEAVLYRSDAPDTIYRRVRLAK